MSDIGATELDAALEALADQFADLGTRLHLVVIGGSGLIAIDAVARTSRDVDVVALEQGGVLVSAEPLPVPLAEAASIVARDLGLEPNWLNPARQASLVHGLPDGFPKRVTTRDYGPSLRVSFAARVDQVCLKLYAAADRREPRDFADLRQLEPTVTELRAAARWARSPNMPGPFDDAMRQALEDLGVEDDGRIA